jgi:hypothetical protein
MDSEPWTWHWPPFFIYSLAIFFAALAAGLLGAPGIVVVVAGMALGAWAAARRWFEVPAGVRETQPACERRGPW